MRYLQRLIFGALLLFGVESFAAPLFVISIDGLHPDYVMQADRYGLKIPVLRSFARDGTYASGVIGVLPTVTYPSHTTMMTGLMPAEHGISGNTTFDPMLVNREGWYWYASDIKGRTLWSAAAQAQLTTAAINWPVTVGDPHIKYLVPEYWRASTQDDLKLMRALARPIGLLEDYEKQLGAYVDGNTNDVHADRVRTRFAVKLIAEQRPDFMAIHLASLDETEHEDGPFQKTAFENLEALDAMIGELRAAALKAHPNAVVAIVSDHGFAPTHSVVNLRVPFVDAGLIKLKAADPSRPSAVADWTAQVWPSGGGAAIVLRDRKNESVRKQVDALLTRFKADARNGIARVFNADELRLRGGFPEADWFVECAEGFYMGSAVRGDIVARAPLKGMHGYGPDHQSMHAAFFMQGLGVGKHGFGAIDMRQLAPTFAKILGISLPEAKQPAVAFE